MSCVTPSFHVRSMLTPRFICGIPKSGSVLWALAKLLIVRLAVVV